MAACPRRERTTCACCIAALRHQRIVQLQHVPQVSVNADGIAHVGTDERRGIDMATVTTIYTAHAATGRFATLRTDLRQRFEAWKLYRRTLSELGRLSDRELNDLGLHRSGIRGIAYDSAYGER